MRRIGVVVVAALAASLAFVARPAGGVTQQFTWYDQVVTHTSSSYAQPTQSASTPPNWTSPVNYAAGTVFTRIQVLEKPSTKALDLQLCVWRNSYTQESCTLTNLRFSTTGTYYVNFGSPNSWWKKNGSWSWTTPFSPTRLMIKDPNTGLLMQNTSCGAYCSPPSATNGHIPIKIDASAIVVAPGATLAPPTKWAGCPSSWSPACSGGGSTTSTTRATTTTTRPATTTTTRPVTTGTVAMIVGNASQIPSKDVATRSRLVGMGKTVALIDDDNLGSSTALGAAGLVVVASSVVPSKIPAWLATHPAPLLDLEAYVQTTLRLATSGRELPDRTTLRIANTSHALAAGRSGDVVVQGRAPIAVATPVSSAAVIARLPGATTASLYGIEKGGALTSGTAPARRVGFFFSYDSPPTATTAGWALFDAAVRWLQP